MNLKAKSKNYSPESMSFSAGFLGFQSKPDNKVFMYVDEEKAVKIINSLLEKSIEIESAELGLDGDFNENSTTIYENGEFYSYDCYHGSRWAEPVLIVNYKNGKNECFSCWFQKIEIQSNTVENKQTLALL